MKRRDFLTRSIAGLAGTALAAHGLRSAPLLAATEPRRVRQSVMGWCFNPMDMLELAKHCKRIGLEAMEGIPSKLYPQVTAMGLKISLTGSHGFQKGPLDPANHPDVETKLRDGIDLAKQFGAPNVITFTGMRKTGISDATARKNCL
ncbi:MAG: sugar phosphate isomerase, partial [Planctomycetota bacterium]